MHGTVDAMTTMVMFRARGTADAVGLAPTL